MNGKSLYIPYRGKAPKYVSRRHPQSVFNSVAYETDAPPAPPKKDPVKPDTRTQEELLTEINELVKRELKNAATKEELEATVASQRAALSEIPVEELRDMLDPKNPKGLMGMVIRQGLEVQRLSTKLETATRQGQDMSLRGQITRWVEENKDAIKGATNKQRNQQLSPMSLRLDSPMFVSTVNNTASPYIGKTYVESGVNDFIRIQPNFWDYIKKGRTSAATYVWVNKTSPSGAADFIGPGVAKPGVSFKLAAEVSVAKKVAASAKAGTEILKDIEGMASMIEDEIRYQILIAANTAAMTGVSSSTDINGIQTLSVAFPVGGGGLATTNPTYMDAIRAGAAYMRSGLLTGALTVFINPIDAANMDMAKATDSGVYMLPPFVTANGRVIGGATVVEDTNIPVGSVQFAFLQYYRILMYEDLFVEWGWENDDFTKNLVTAIGEMRFHQMFNSIYTGAFMFDTFTNIITAITAP